MDSIIFASKGSRMTAIATEQIFPGEWVTWSGTEGIVVKQQSSVNVTGMIVIEDSMNGFEITDGYAVGAPLQLIVVQNGDVVYTRCDQELVEGVELLGVAEGITTPLAKPVVDTFFIGISLEPTLDSSPFWVKMQVAR